MTLYLPLAVSGDPEVVLATLRDPATVQQFMDLPPGFDFPLVDHLRARVVCVHKVADPSNPYAVSKAHVLAALDDNVRAPIDAEPLGRLTARDLRGLVAGGPCDAVLDDCPTLGQDTAEAVARRRAMARRGL